MRFVRLLWITSRPGGAWVGSVSNKHNPSKKLGLGACISSRITTVIHVIVDHQINYNCFNEPFAVSPYRSLYWDMHGLIFETSIWLLAGSTRFLRTTCGQLTRKHAEHNWYQYKVFARQTPHHRSGWCIKLWFTFSKVWKQQSMSWANSHRELNPTWKAAKLLLNARKQYTHRVMIHKLKNRHTPECVSRLAQSFTRCPQDAFAWGQPERLWCVNWG